MRGTVRIHDRRLCHRRFCHGGLLRRCGDSPADVLAAVVLLNQLHNLRQQHIVDVAERNQRIVRRGIRLCGKNDRAERKGGGKQHRGKPGSPFFHTADLLIEISSYSIHDFSTKRKRFFEIYACNLRKISRPYQCRCRWRGRRRSESRPCRTFCGCRPPRVRGGRRGRSLPSCRRNRSVRLPPRGQARCR